MWFEDFFQWLQDLDIPTRIREGESLFPWIESIHVLAIALVVGTIMMVDLRLLGLASMDRPVGRLARGVLVCTWIAFAFAALTGGLLFAANAVTYAGNFFFRGKMVLLALAGLNMGCFHLGAGRAIDNWGAGVTPPPGARIAGGLSLTLWILVICFGRWIGFTLK